eukprot:8917821-Pyramimonas_sp.AAC.1
MAAAPFVATPSGPGQQDAPPIRRLRPGPKESRETWAANYRPPASPGGPPAAPLTPSATSAAPASGKRRERRQPRTGVECAICRHPCRGMRRDDAPPTAGGHPSGHRPRAQRRHPR